MVDGACSAADERIPAESVDTPCPEEIRAPSQDQDALLKEETLTEANPKPSDAAFCQDESSDANASSLLGDGLLANPQQETSASVDGLMDASPLPSAKPDIETSIFQKDGFLNSDFTQDEAVESSFLEDTSLWEEDKGIEEMDEDVKGALQDAAEAREDLVIQWREVCKPRRAGAIAPKAKGSRKDFAPLFDEWLRARKLEDALMEDGFKDGWKIYRYLREPKVKYDEETWETAFHGTWWYSVWLVLHSGVFLESNDRDKGHDFWEPGVYCSPNLSTARWYARPHILFGDGVYHRIIFELRVNTEKRIRNRQRGGVQWVFKPDAVSLYAVWVQRNAPPANGEERINDWDPKLEARPPGEELVDVTVNPFLELRRADEWSETEMDEDGEEEPEDQPLPPHLHASNHSQNYPVPTSSSLPPARGCRPTNSSGTIFGRLGSSNPYTSNQVIPSAANRQLQQSTNGRIPAPVPNRNASFRPPWTAAPRAPVEVPPRSGRRQYVQPIGGPWNGGARSAPRTRLDTRPNKRKFEEPEKEKEEDPFESFEMFLTNLQLEQQKKEEEEEEPWKNPLPCLVAPLKAPRTLAAVKKTE